MGFDGAPLNPEVAFQAWQCNGDWDERPAHEATISRPFYMGEFEVTNAEYEQFDPDHRKVRGKLGFSTGDQDAVVFVNWHDANRFCQWLSKKEGLPCRLPTRAEWEHACRAGTHTHFSTRDTLPAPYLKNATRSYYPPPAPVDSAVDRTPPNAWGYSVRCRHGYDTLCGHALAVIAGLGTIAILEPAAEDIDENGQPFMAGLSRRPDVKVQAILATAGAAKPEIGVRPRLLHTGGAELVGIADTLPTEDWLRLFPSKLPDRRPREGYSLEAADSVLWRCGAFENSVFRFHAIGGGQQIHEGKLEANGTKPEEQTLHRCPDSTPVTHLQSSR